MDSLHVTSQPQPPANQGGSKTSSRSTSPCRPRAAAPPEPIRTETGGVVVPHPHVHHAKTLSHGSDSGKSLDGASPGNVTTHRPSRHRSPTSVKFCGDSVTTMADDSAHLSTDLTDLLTDTSDLLDTSDYNVSFLSNGSRQQQQQQQQQQQDGGVVGCDDVTDAKMNATLERLSTKIVTVRDLIKTEQKLRDDNVNEYLKLAANADKQQVQRIKAVFEKKNQKSAQTISQLQKKLDCYQKRVHELETHGLTQQSHRPPREMLRDMGQGLKNVGGNIRDGITGFSGAVISKPREFAHLIKNKFGSADNISQLSTWYIGPGAATTGSEGSGTNGGGGVVGGAGTGSDQGHAHHHQHQHHGGSATLPATLHAATSQSSMAAARAAQVAATSHQPRKFPSDEGSGCSSVTSDSIGRFGRVQEGHHHHHDDPEFKVIYKELTSKQEEIDTLKDKLEEIKTLPQEVHYLSTALQEERFRTERLEEQINDLTELHQNEVENLKQAMADMEEKVQYQSEERLRDIHEILEHCQTKIQKMEHQALQQQQYVTLEGLDNSNARALVVKLINILLTVLQVVLLLMATGAGIIMPFLRTRVRILTTVFIVLATIFVLRQWPEVQDIGSHMMKRLKDMLDPVK